MPYSQEWLDTPGVRRCILAEVNVYNVLTTLVETKYFSTSGYLTTSSDVFFEPIITGGMRFSETISASGGISISYGDIELANPNGELDSWLDPSLYIWANQPVALYFGDPTWACTNLAQVKTDFKLIFNGVASDIDARSRNAVNIKVRDKMQRLNTPLTENKVGVTGSWGAGGQTNSDVIRPLVFGEVHNYEPIMLNPAVLQYIYNDGSSEKLLELRDNGVPIYTADTGLLGATVNNAAGTFTLNAPLVGQLTASAQGVKNSINLTNGSLVTGTYSNNIANIIALIVTQYGDAAKRLVASDLDLTNLAAFQTANTQSIGILVSEKQNVLEVCNMLAGSIGAQLFFTREGKLQLLRFGVLGTSVTTITQADIVNPTLTIAERLDVIASTKLGYAKNYTVQPNIVTAIPQANKDMFAEEWLTVTVTNGTTKTLYKLSGEPAQKDTALIVKSEATTEATRLNTYYSIPRIVFRFTGYARLLSLNLGDTVTLQHPRFGLSAGKQGQVVSLNPDWLKGTVDIEVVV